MISWSPENISAASLSLSILWQNLSEREILHHHDQILAIRPEALTWRCWSILLIAHRSASTSERKAVFHRLKFYVPISWIFLKLSIQTQPQPLVEVHEPSTVFILSKLMTWDSSYYVLVEWGLPFHLHWTMLDIYFPHIKLVLKDPCLSLEIVYRFEPFKYTKLFRDKIFSLLLVWRCYSFSRKDSPY